MPHRSPLPRPIALALQTLVAALLALQPESALGQRVGGAIGVSLTVLEPLATQAVEVTALRVGRDGIATVETTAPTTGPTSQLVMARVTSFAGATEARRAAVVHYGNAVGAGDGRRRGGRISHRIDVGRAAASAPIRDVQLRIEYLAVAGT
jgi:hypothetical protein